MKYLLLLLMIALPCYAEYGGSTMYPATKCSSRNITIVKDEVVQTKTYSQLYTALADAVTMSQQFPESSVIVRTADISCTTAWKTLLTVTSQSSSSVTSEIIVQISSASSSSIDPLLKTWSAPTQRENGDTLAATEIAGYEVRYHDGDTKAWTHVTLLADTRQFRLSQTMNGFEVAAVDINGLYSNFVSF